MAGKALLQHSRISRFAIVEMSISPATRRRILLRILDHKLNAILWWARNERLTPAKDFIVFLRRIITPRDSGNDRAVRKRKLAIAVSFDRNVVAQNGANVVEIRLPGPPRSISNRGIRAEFQLRRSEPRHNEGVRT